MREMVVLLDDACNEIGVAEKLEAHRKGLLHRAFSIFVFDKDKRVLLQKRAAHKYHSGGLWANTCCSHPMPGEDLEDAVHRRLVEEMGFDCRLREVFSFTYKEAVDDRLIEHEHDHVFVGLYDGPVEPNPDEVEEYEWRSWHKFLQDVANNPENYSSWLRLIIKNHDDLPKEITS